MSHHGLWMDDPWMVPTRERCVGNTDWYDYDAWSPAPLENWINTGPEHDHEVDPHVDLGCGTIPKGRIGIDRYPAPGVAVVADLDGPDGPSCSYRVDPGDDMMDVNKRVPMFGVGLPFADSSIKSIISCHAFEHVGAGFVKLIDECYRVLEPDGILRAITPLFPSLQAVTDPDHKRYFTDETWSSFCGHTGDDNNPTGIWTDAFSVPYTRARFQLVDMTCTPWCDVEHRWCTGDSREIRVSLRANK